MSRVACAYSLVMSSYGLKNITPHFGAEVHGFDLSGSAPLPADVLARIKDDVKTHRLLIFKGQGELPGERQVRTRMHERTHGARRARCAYSLCSSHMARKTHPPHNQVQITQQLGHVESTFYKHPRCAHSCVRSFLRLFVRDSLRPCVRTSVHSRVPCRVRVRISVRVRVRVVPCRASARARRFKTVSTRASRWRAARGQRMPKACLRAYAHAHRSPHPDVFRVSNDEREGCTGVGRTGWHIDGA